MRQYKYRTQINDRAYPTGFCLLNVVRPLKWLIVLSLLLGLFGCSSSGLFRSTAHEQTFRNQYGQRQWYTAITLRPYAHSGGYLIDLTGTIAEAQFDTYRAATSIPFGSRIRLIDFADNAILARIEGYLKFSGCLFPPNAAQPTTWRKRSHLSSVRTRHSPPSVP